MILKLGLKRYVRFITQPAHRGEVGRQMDGWGAWGKTYFMGLGSACTPVNGIWGIVYNQGLTVIDPSLANR